MRTLQDWTAKRAGGRITVYGLDTTTGEKTRVAGVEWIMPRSGEPFAVYARTKEGEDVCLRVGSTR